MKLFPERTSLETLGTILLLRSRLPPWPLWPWLSDVMVCWAAANISSSLSAAERAKWRKMKGREDTLYPLIVRQVRADSYSAPSDKPSSSYQDPERAHILRKMEGKQDQSEQVLINAQGLIRLVITSDIHLLSFSRERQQLQAEYGRHGLGTATTALQSNSNRVNGWNTYLDTWNGEYWCDDRVGDGDRHDHEGKQIHSPTFLHWRQHIWVKEERQNVIVIKGIRGTSSCSCF